MTRAVTVRLALGHEHLDVASRIGAHEGPDFCFAVPAPHDWLGDECHAFVAEAFALLHFPVIDTLVFEVPAAQLEQWRARLEQYAGRHVVRDTECRSQQLAVTVRRVQIEPETARR